MIEGRIEYKSFSTNPDYFVLCGEGVASVVQEETQSDYAVGELVKVEGTEKDGKIYAESVGLVEGEREKQVEEKLEKFLEKECRASEPKLLVEDETLGKAVPKIMAFASFLKKKIYRLTPIIIRFHDDTDGITSGLLLRAAIRQFAMQKKLPYPDNFVRDKQAKSAIYEAKDAESDAETAEDYAKPPLLLLLDHGVNEESVHALKKVHEHGLALAAIDHHPFDERAPRLLEAFLSSREFGGSSSHTAGLLSFEVAHAMAGKADERLAWYSLQGDKSSFAKGFRKQPIVLDYLATQNSGGLEQYEKALADDAGTDALYRKIIALQESVKEKALKATETVKAGNGSIQLVDLSKIVKKKYPTTGDCVQLVHLSHAEDQTPVITIGFDGERVVFRVNAAAAEKFSASRLIAQLKAEQPDAIASGGGHERAASLRLKPGKVIIERVLELVKKDLEQ